MRKALTLILGFVVVCSELLSHEPSLRFYLPGRLEQSAAAPEGIGLRSFTGSNPLNAGLSELGSPRRLSVQTLVDLSAFVDDPRKTLISDLRTSEENDAGRNRIRTQRLYSGLGLAVSWAATVAVDLLVWDFYRSTTVIPVAGPWITLARMASNNDPGWPGAKTLLILSGVAQTGFATYFIISLARHPKPRETKTVAISANFNTINLRIQF